MGDRAVVHQQVRALYLHCPLLGIDFHLQVYAGQQGLGGVMVPAVALLVGGPLRGGLRGADV